MNTKNILLVALEQELPKEYVPEDFYIVYTGVGKVNAARTATEAILESGYEGFTPVVYNYGTAGSIVSDLEGLHKVDNFYQRDMITHPLRDRGYTPYDSLGGAFLSEHKNMRTIATGDSFATFLDPWYLENNIDFVDMEAYAIKKVCSYYNIDFICYKFVTDYVGSEHQADTWAHRVQLGIDDIVHTLFD